MGPLELIHSVRLITDVCLEVSPGENVLCIADREGDMEVITLIAAECRARGADAAAVLIEPRKAHYHEPPRAIARAMQEADVVIAAALTKGRLKVKTEKKPVSYHDPCRLSRGLGIHKAPRQILSKLGVKLIEMKRNREDTYCCGFPAHDMFPGFSRSVGRERMAELKETGAEILVTACALCKEMFQGMVPKNERERVRDRIELVDTAT